MHLDLVSVQVSSSQRIGFLPRNAIISSDCEPFRDIQGVLQGFYRVGKNLFFDFLKMETTKCSSNIKNGVFLQHKTSQGGPPIQDKLEGVHPNPLTGVMGGSTQLWLCMHCNHSLSNQLCKGPSTQLHPFENNPKKPFICTTTACKAGW